MVHYYQLVNYLALLAGTSLLVVVEESVDSGSESELTDSSTALDDDALLELFSVDVDSFFMKTLQTTGR